MFKQYRTSDSIRNVPNNSKYTNFEILFQLQKLVIVSKWIIANLNSLLYFGVIFRLNEQYCSIWVRWNYNKRQLSIVKVTWIVSIEYQHRSVVLIWLKIPSAREEASHYMNIEWHSLITQCWIATELFVETPVSNQSSSRSIVLTCVLVGSFHG